MDAQANVWTYKGPAELVDAVAGRFAVTAEFEVEVEDMGFDSLAKTVLRSWAGSATGEHPGGSLIPFGECEVLLPSGQRGRACVETSVESAGYPLELSFSVQGVGEAPWWSSSAAPS